VPVSPVHRANRDHCSLADFAYQSDSRTNPNVFQLSLVQVRHSWQLSTVKNGRTLTRFDAFPRARDPEALTQKDDRMTRFLASFLVRQN